MKVRQYLNIILKKIWLVLLIPLCTTAVSAVVSFFVQKPVYESTITLYIIYDKVDSDRTFENIPVGQQFIKDFREIIRSRSVSSTLINELEMNNIKPEKLAGKIRVGLKGETRIIQIAARHDSPIGAQKLVEKVCSLFIERMEHILGKGSIEVLDTADIPLNPSYPKPLLNIVIAFATGFFAAAGIVILLEYIDNTIKTAEDIENCLEIKVLGAIPLLDIK